MDGEDRIYTREELLSPKVTPWLQLRGIAKAMGVPVKGRRGQLVEAILAAQAGVPEVQEDVTPEAESSEVPVQTSVDDETQRAPEEVALEKENEELRKRIAKLQSSAQAALDRAMPTTEDDEEEPENVKKGPMVIIRCPDTAQLQLVLDEGQAIRSDPATGSTIEGRKPKIILFKDHYYRTNDRAEVVAIKRKFADQFKYGKLQFMTDVYRRQKAVLEANLARLEGRAVDSGAAPAVPEDQPPPAFVMPPGANLNAVAPQFAQTPGPVGEEWPARRAEPEINPRGQHPERGRFPVDEPVSAGVMPGARGTTEGL